MKIDFKSITISLSLLGISTALYADDLVPAKNALKDTLSFMPAKTTGMNISVDADFIYWLAKQEGLSYAYTGLTALRSPNTGYSIAAGTVDFVTSSGQDYHVHSRMKPGFKIGFEMDLGYDGWDTYLSYTWLNSKAGGAVRQGSDLNEQVVYPTLMQNTTESLIPGSISDSDFFTFMTSAKARWSLHFNNIDWELGRAYLFSSNLILRPHIGLKGTWQRQTFNVDYNNIYTVSVFFPMVPNYQGYYNAYFEQYFWGLGSRVGLDTSWQFYPQWSLYGNWALSGLWGQFKAHRYDIVNDAGTSPERQKIYAEIVNLYKSFHTLRAVLELALGVRWDYRFSADKYKVSLLAGWEEQIWFNQTNLGLYSSYFNQGGDSLTMQGLTFKVSFDF